MQHYSGSLLTNLYDTGHLVGKLDLADSHALLLPRDFTPPSAWVKEMFFDPGKIRMLGVI
jgi:hypothetical protein